MKYLTLLYCIMLFSYSESKIFEKFLMEYEIVDANYLQEKLNEKKQKICFKDNNLTFEKIIDFIDEKIYYSCLSEDKYEIYSVNEHNGDLENVISISKINKQKINKIKVTNNFLLLEKKTEADHIGGRSLYEVQKINLEDKKVEIIENEEVGFFKNNVLNQIFYIKYENLELYKIDDLLKKRVFEKSNNVQYGIAYVDNDIAISSSSQKVYDDDDNYLRTEREKIYQYDKFGGENLIYKTNFGISSIYVTDDKRYLFIDNTENKEAFFKKRKITTKLYIMDMESKKIEEIKDTNFIYRIYKMQGNKLFLIKNNK